MTERVRTGAAYFGNRFVAHARQDLSRMAGVCDHVVHTVSEADLHFHKRALAEIFGATRRLGLEVWADPWGVGGVFGGESLSKFLLDRPDAWQVLSDGSRRPAACLNRPLFRRYVREWIVAVRDMGADVIFWDEPHPFFRWDLEWEGIYGCVCAVCRDLFRETYGSPPPPRLDGPAREFRRESLAAFLEEMFADAHRLGLRNALCLYAFDGHEEYDRVWARLAGLPRLDVFGTDPYWRWRPLRNDPAAHVCRFAEKVVRSAAPRGIGSQIWIQAMRLPRGTEPEIGAACRAAAEAGAGYVTAWSYDGGALLDPVLSEDPSAVWEAVEKAFRGLRGFRG